MHERPKAIGDGDDVLHSMTPLYEGSSADQREQKLSKVCAKFQGGVKWGLGMKFERTCRDDTCHKGCQGTLFQRQCRIFDFRPHYTVRTISKNDAVGIDLKVSFAIQVTSPRRTLLTVHIYTNIESRLVCRFPFGFYTLLDISDCQ
jgi:hypothetical protein